MRNKKFLLIIALFALILVPACSYSNEFYSDGDVIVVLRSPISDSIQASAFAESSEATVTTIFPEISEVSDNTFMLIHSDTKNPEELTEELLKNPEVLAASPNYTVYASAVYPDDTYFEDCWGISGANGVNAPEAWEYSQGSSEIYVAIIDSGIDYSNPDLVQNIDMSLALNTINGSSYSAADQYGHGTHVAGIIGAKGDNGMGIAGLNWNVKLIPIKALNDSGKGSIASVMSAINYVISLINSGVNIRAVNMSFETYIKMVPNYQNLSAYPFWRAFKNLDRLNQAVTVVAAGNYQETVGQPSTTAHHIVPGAGYYVYPASFKGLNNFVTVGALQSNGSLANFSNRGSDITAPGVNILSTWISTTSNKYYQIDGVSLKAEQGTSMAAPFVSGAVALLASIADEDITAYQLKKILLRDVSSSSSITNSASEIPLKVDQVLELYASNKDNESLFPATPPESEYDAYDSQSTQSSPNTYTNNNNNYNDYSDNSVGSSGGCGINIFAGLALIVLFPLAKKLMN